MQTGPLMGIIFVAFVMGVGLMGGLWCIYYNTGNEISFPLTLKNYGTKYIIIPNPSCDRVYSTFDI